MGLPECRWFFQQLVLVFDFYHRLGLKNREVCSCISSKLLDASGPCSSV